MNPTRPRGFTPCVVIYVGRKRITTGEGKTKKAAATQAAMEMVFILEGQVEASVVPEENESASGDDEKGHH
ncbi:putative dsRNA-binding protein [Ktedonospora formicarum]|uniref:DRBM domain-containing protein n=1 Tax=Ktedonospora formicarum TaxID=2778364 RepID=A0A8J3MVV4_9CHLR|nr:hypothetical protein KSX_64890 [Ktedonospora formicarum]